jgi:hypothetical protein
MIQTNVNFIYVLWVLIGIVLIFSGFPDFYEDSEAR